MSTRRSTFDLSVLLALPGFVGSCALLLLLFAPVVALALTTSFAQLVTGMQHPLVGPALWLSARTSAVALVMVVAGGIPLAWVVARSPASWARLLELLLALPIVMPPAVVGIALLLVFGRSGVLGNALGALGIALPFTPGAVVIAQIVVSAPYFIKAAISGFRGVDADLLLVARTLGAGRVAACARVGLPAALPALLSGAVLAWARAVGEFGATLLFAGSLPERTQTMPLAIYSALQADVDVARALAIVLGLASLGTLLLVHALGRLKAIRAWGVT